ncbi:MAG: hypothetical protein IH901_06255 [Proteobacteria bacterium]|nr:hypothetical protein [Pseudomonadota bacterium]
MKIKEKSALNWELIQPYLILPRNVTSLAKRANFSEQEVIDLLQKHREEIKILTPSKKPKDKVYQLINKQITKEFIFSEILDNLKMG